METDIPMHYREDFFRAVADTVSDPVTLVGKDFRILHHNKRVSNLYGSILRSVLRPCLVSGNPVKIASCVTFSKTVNLEKESKN
jgi:hypothetical protein